MSTLLEQNFGTMEKLAEGLKTRGTDYGSFDFVIYQLIEEGLIEAEAGNFGRAIWEGKEIAECEACNEFSTDLMLHQDSGLTMCSGCYEEEAE
jgi:hypothetical protein